MYDLHLLLSLVIWLVLSAAFFNGPSASAFHPLTYYLAFHGLVFVIRPFFQHYFDFSSIYMYYQFWPEEDVKHLALFASNVGLASFYIGVLWFGSTPMRFWSDGSLDRADRHGLHLLIALALLSPLILYSITYAASINFGDIDLRRLTRDPTTLYTIYSDTTAYLTEANVMLGGLGVLIAWGFRFRPLALVPFCVFVAFRLAVGWSRYTFIMSTISLALFYLFEKRVKWFKLRLLPLFLAIVSAFLILSSQRSIVADFLSGRTSHTYSQVAERHFFDGMDFASLEFLEYIINIVPSQTLSFNYFSNSLEIFTAPIPRMFWPEKPVGPPVKFFNINDYGFPMGITVSLIGEGWQSLGMAGVAIWCLLGGILWGSIYRYFVMNLRSTYVVSFYLLLLPFSIQWFRDGYLLSLVKAPFFFMLPLLLSYMLGRVFPVNKRVLPSTIARSNSTRNGV
jgi:hypothetical protein